MLYVLFGQVDALAGNSGWVGAGLLGAVLAWLMFVHLPAKDRQTREMVELLLRESEANRVARQKAASVFQQGIEEVVSQAAKESKETRSQHAADAERDRTAFLQRNSNVVLALENQTLRLEAAIAKSCRLATSGSEDKAGPCTAS